MSFEETEEEETQGRWTQRREPRGHEPRTTRSLPTQKREEKMPLLTQEPGEGAWPCHTVTADFWPPDRVRMNSWRFTPPSLQPFIAVAPGKLTQLTSVGVASRQTNIRCHAPALMAHLGKDPHRGERLQKPVSPEPPGERYRSWRSRCGRQKCPDTAEDPKTQSVTQPGPLGPSGDRHHPPRPPPASCLYRNFSLLGIP